MTSEEADALLERAKTGDSEALSVLYDEHAPLIYSYVYRRVHNKHVAEDLTSEVFVRVLRAIQARRLWRTSFRAWLYRIAHNLVIDHYRKQPAVPMLPVEEQLLVSQDNVEVMHQEKVRVQQLESAIEQLTEHQQQVIALRFGEQLKSREVAEVMGKSVGAVEALQYRALNTLRVILSRKEKDKDREG